ncbi:MAG: MFS transporter, partial [Spirochaetia bacterium]|nr:MFS transporter [Spirochaetia bacterium]
MVRSFVSNLTRALRHRNYFYFFIGHGVSLIGTWMQQIAVSWLVYRLTHSPFLLGLSAFFNQIPGLLLMSFAGVIADRFPRRTLLMVTQALSLLQASFLAFLVLDERVEVWHLLVLGFSLGVVNTFDIPARQAFLSELVPKQDLGNAIALNSTIFHGARLIGPLVAGALIAVWSEGICFAINAGSYLAVLGALFLIRTGAPKKKRRGQMFAEWKEGFDYVRRDPFIRTLLLRMTGMSLLGMPYLSLLPVFAKDGFHGDSHTLGFLMGAAGMGALAGALLLAVQKGTANLKGFLTAGGFAFAISLGFFSQTGQLNTAAFLMFAAGLGMMLQMAAANTLIQSRVRDDMRGRAMSFFALANMGVTPLGVLGIGFLAERFGAQAALLG